VTASTMRMTLWISSFSRRILRKSGRPSGAAEASRLARLPLPYLEPQSRRSRRPPRSPRGDGVPAVSFSEAATGATSPPRRFPRGRSPRGQSG
jgi:hypothetical protein